MYATAVGLVIKGLKNGEDEVIVEPEPKAVKKKTDSNFFTKIIERSKMWLNDEEDMKDFS
jgi:hypothetical protein